MKQKVGIIGLLAFFVVIMVSLFAQAQSANPQETLNQYVSELQKNPNDNALREKIIKLVQTMKPAPAVPKEAERYMTRGIAAMKDAKSADDFKDAVKEFEKASLSAPWFANAYYNLGIAQDKAGLYAEAIKSLNLYLIAAPEAPDVKTVEKLIYEVEYRQEKAAKESSPVAIASKKKKEEEEFIKRLNGARYEIRDRYKDGTSDVDTWEIRGNQIFRTYVLNDPIFPRPPSESSFTIQERQIFIEFLTSFCMDTEYRASKCGYRGTISENSLTFEFQADGKTVPRLMAGPSDYIPRLK